MKTFYRYTVAWAFDKDIVVNEGFLLAEDWAEAASILQTRFDMIENISLEPVNDSDILDFRDILEYMTPKYDEGEPFGPQLIAAIQEAIEITREEAE